MHYLQREKKNVIFFPPLKSGKLHGVTKVRWQFAPKYDKKTEREKERKRDREKERKRERQKDRKTERQKTCKTCRVN